MTKKPKPSLHDAVGQAAEVKNRQAISATDVTSGAQIVKDRYQQSAINLKRSDWDLLKKVAQSRSYERGGRASVSKVIEDLIKANRDQLSKDSLYEISAFTKPSEE